MRKFTAPPAVLALIFLSIPAAAWAAETPTTDIPMVPSTLQWLLSLVGLSVAIFGLYMISNISKLTKGGAISGRASYIIVAFMLLGIASMLNVAVYSFKIEISHSFIAHIDEALRITAMGFFVLYFQRVLAGLRGYVNDLGAAEKTFTEDASAE